MTRKKQSRSIVGIAWYRPEQWVELKEFSEDRDNMDPTHEAWKTGAEKVMHELRSKGERVEPVDFDLDEFKMWCRTNTKRPTAAARSEFASIKLRDAHKA
jgi:hypothetical protein